MFILRRIRKRIKGIFAVLAALTMAFSVGRNNEPNEPSSETTKGLILSTTKIETTVVTESGSQKSENQNETYIILADDMTTINGRGASFSDGVVTVSKSGNYSFKGELNDGRIVVNLKDDGEVRLNFYGVNISSSKGAAVSVLKAPEGAELHFGKGTYNTLADTDERALSFREADGDSAVVFSKDDIVLTGEGTLSVKADFNKGVFSEKDVTLKDAQVSIVSFDDGIRSLDNVRVENSELLIVSGGDGIHADDKNGDAKGKLLSHSSKITVFGDMDGIDCSGDIFVFDSELDITVGDGSKGRNHHGNHDSIFDDNNISDKNKNDIFASGRATADSSTLERFMEKNISLSGIAGDSEGVFSDTIIKINSAQHGISCESIETEDGFCSLKCDGNGLFAKEDISVDGTDVNIMAYGNGIEGEEISLLDGKIFISAMGEAVVSSEGEDVIEIDSAFVQTERIGSDKSIVP